jgi:hypothetical protein
MSDRRVTVHIGRVVLRGIDPVNQKAFESGLRTELARVLNGPSFSGEISQSRRTAALRLGKITMQPGIAGARALGTGVARVIGTQVNP